MRKPIVASLIMAMVVLVGTFFTSSLAQALQADTSTFYHPVSGTYVNGWPRFTIHYPKEWVEVRPRPEVAFVAAAPMPARDLQLAVVSPHPFPLPLDKFADFVLPVVKTMGTDPTIVSNKPSRLRDGTPAQEVEFRVVVNGTPLHWLELATKKGDVVVHAEISSGAVIGEDLEAILSSLEFQPRFDEPVKLPPDVQAFLDSFCNDVVSHDLEKVMSHYSDAYLNSGMRKGEMERFFRQVIGPVTSFELGITDFVPAGERAYVAGFVSTYFGKAMLRETSIIKENGEWRWYGDQRDPPLGL